MDIANELRKSLTKNSFEDCDNSLKSFPYMNGYIPPIVNGEIMIYEWDEQEGKNKRVWKKVEEISG